MNQDIRKLYELGNKPNRIIIGLMSGTSLDGLDVAVCKCESFGKQTKIELLHFANRTYSSDERKKLLAITRKDQVDLQMLCMMNPWIANLHAHIVLEQLKKWNLKAEDIDLIASHGQTVYHAPASKHQMPDFPSSSLQLGDGDHIAVKTGILTISDFRQKDVAAGNEGAPLAMYADDILFASQNESRILLNIGGIANFTFLPANATGSPVTMDTGPGNAMMDAFINSIDPAKAYDENGQMAASGSPDKDLLSALFDHEFFRTNQLSTGTELFNLEYLKGKINNNISNEDIMATLAMFTAQSIANAIRKNCAAATNLYVSGGGAYNENLLAILQDLLPEIIVKQTTELGVDPDAKEAMLFAILANELIGGSNTLGGYTMGKISLPH